MKVTSRWTGRRNENLSSSPIKSLDESVYRVRGEQVAMGPITQFSIKCLFMNNMHYAYCLGSASMQVPDSPMAGISLVGVLAAGTLHTRRLLSGVLEPMVTIPHSARADTLARTETVKERTSRGMECHKELPAGDRIPLAPVSIPDLLHVTSQTERV